VAQQLVLLLLGVVVAVVMAVLVLNDRTLVRVALVVVVLAQMCKQQGCRTTTR
jgi:flagellar biosynthesis protein FliQ